MVQKIYYDLISLPKYSSWPEFIIIKFIGQFYVTYKLIESVKPSKILIRVWFFICQNVVITQNEKKVFE